MMISLATACSDQDHIILCKPAKPKYYRAYNSYHETRCSYVGKPVS
jgi:hypothetical protein